MGQGYSYKCKKCHCGYSAHFGVGMMYPEVYSEKLAEIKNGAYGSDWKELCEKTAYVALNAKTVIYVCDACKKWEHGTDVTLYAPNDPNLIAKRKYGIKTVEEWEYVPYVSEGKLKTDYHMIKRYFRKCDKCGRRMHKANKKEIESLPCPKCGEPNTFDCILMWD